MSVVDKALNVFWAASTEYFVVVAVTRTARPGGGEGRSLSAAPEMVRYLRDHH